MGMSVYTSLLIKDYKRKAGDVKALRKDLREIAKIVLMKQRELAALEAIIRSREPEFDPTNIKPIGTHPRIMGLKWNKLTTLILECLRMAAGEPVPSDKIGDYVMYLSGKEDCERGELVLFRRCIQKRLKGLAAAGKIIRHHNPCTNAFGVWSLPRDE
jgi:hypothetical protein